MQPAARPLRIGSAGAQECLEAGPAEYEACPRKVFPAPYGAAIEVCDDEEEAAWIAQVAFLESYGELLS